MMRAPIFIVGCPRSGTTLLRNLLRSHPNLTFPRESHFIPPFYRSYGDPQNERDAIALAERVLSLSWIKRWQLQARPEQFAGCRTFRAFVSALFECWADSEAKPRWGDKTPHYVTEIPTLLRLFPAARIIHIYRDGRDVALSWVKSKLDPGNLYTAAMLWQSWVTAGRRASALLPDDAYLEVRYEELVAHLAPTMKDVCRFVQEPFTEDVLRPNPLPQGGRIKALTVSTTEVVSTNVDKWKSEMTESDRRLFATVAGDLLEELGYEAAGRPRRISPMERMIWRGHHLVVRSADRMRLVLDPVHIRTAWEFRWAEARRVPKE